MITAEENFRKYLTDVSSRIKVYSDCYSLSKTVHKIDGFISRKRKYFEIRGLNNQSHANKQHFSRGLAARGNYHSCLSHKIARLIAFSNLLFRRV